MLDFIYCGELGSMSLERDHVELLVAADMYDLLALKAHVEHFISPQLSTANVLRMTELADAHNAPILKKVCLDEL